MIAVELKAGKFEPSHAAQLNYYLEILVLPEADELKALLR